ncbi:MAG TPA: DUF1800 domain-containing protein [Solirubrobacterales bacterium]|nr:DUF1800 domain-containing protein [Solirubrobacterales bacterium]
MSQGSNGEERMEALAARRRRRRRKHGRRRRRPAGSGVSVYKGRFGPAQAERLLWRAGFGPRRGEAERLAKKGLKGAVESLTRPKAKKELTGPPPHDEDGRPLAPADAWGHDHLWWLDRMVRSNRPLVERMTLIWHDWFATSEYGVDSQRLMLHQNEMFRKHGLSTFTDLLIRVTRDPAMLLWLSGSENTKESPNENFARELMELFTLGADRGYTEDDVREQARALTGFQNDWDDGVGPHNFRFDPEQHDGGVKKVFGKQGNFNWRDSCRLCLEHKKHPSFFVEKLWSYFIPVPPSKKTRLSLQRLYVRENYKIRPVVEAILKHPTLYRGPRMVKPPVVYIAGLLRGSRRGIESEDWIWMCDQMNQRLFLPPNVAGWDDARWLDTGSWRARWRATTQALHQREFKTDEPYEPDAPADAVQRAIDYWGSPTISRATRAKLVAFAERCDRGANQSWKRKQYPVLRQNALRILVATSPDMQAA